MARPPTKIDEGIYPYVTDSQLRCLKAIKEAGSQTKAAKLLGVSQAAVRFCYQRAIKRAAKAGYSPDHDMTRPCPPDEFYVKGVSSLYNKDGDLTQQWVKTNARDKDRAEQLSIFAEELAISVKGKFKARKPNAREYLSDLVANYKIGDAHIGLYAYAAETMQENYDTAKSCRDILSAAAYLVSISPPTRVAVLTNVGDWFHANDRKHETPGSGNRLDIDTRQGLVMRCGANCLRDYIKLMLEKHKEVWVINARGNHDPDAATALNIICEAFFHNEPRVKVLQNDPKMLHWTWGATAVFVHHGERKRRQQYEEITNIYRDVCGSSQYIYVDNGHIHHQTKEEIGAAIFETWAPLSARDAYHADSCYASGREMQVVYYHKQYGESGRNRCPIQMVRDLQQEGR